MLRSSVLDGILAGVMIAMGGSVFLACENKVVGAVLFTVALLSICLFGFSLYTGKVGFLVQDHSGKALSSTFLGLLGNLIGTVLMGLVVTAALPNLHEAAIAACEKRMLQTPVQTLLRGFLCGILMYTAVWAYREKKTIAGIVFCIPVFILSGFEHSIADMFYFALAGAFRLSSAWFLLLVVIGNSLGGMLIPGIQALKGRQP
ncbi:MAG: formate/nitrite transporter family protein [Oscillospiraceae bacterium]|nr:formate/nitrite transporter family protein [Oscillospiraceae bacterium]